MAKYYVSFLNDRCIIDASNPLVACANTSDSLGVSTAGLKWKVSELGLDNHMSDIFIDDLEINTYIYNKYKDNNEDNLHPI